MVLARPNLIIGSALLVIGALILIGEFSLREVVPFIGIVLIVAGILMLLRAMPGGLIVGIAVLVLGILLQVNHIDIPHVDWGIVNLVVGIVLVVMGVLKLLGR